MSTFDPTKPCRRRNGAKIIQLARLAKATDRGETWFALDASGRPTLHFPDGRHSLGEDGLDLLNSCARAIISVWAVINAEGGVIMVCKEKPCDPMFAAAGRQVVELTKEVEL